MLRLARFFCSAAETAASATARSSPPAFMVYRSRMGNLPIYTDFRGGGGTKKVTILRKFAGDISALQQEVEQVCGVPTVLFHGRLEVKGNHRVKLGKWLTRLGF
ncbi:hypothetical protein AB1Y20_014606 [Prymnesium parvum]|uniref:Large ribosomal subunit protein mL49 n=1 Tax=Prymnesium parvum TaxID=97485 RepID=A0AB34IEN2_PRYPA